MLKFRVAAVAFFCVGLAASAAATEWPRSDVPPDPAVTFGVLPSGMRYAIMHNATPAGSVSVRLRMGTGSMQESDDQRGLAHFLEHMAFRGSANVADGEIDKSLERLGLRFGADTNASTDQDETIYQFDLPKSDDETVDTVLTYTREIVSNLNLDPAAAKTEAGVVNSELALRDMVSTRALQSELDFTLQDKHATALPSGDPQTIAKADVSQIRKYYNAYYRPDRATLVIVGDIDSKKVEAKIKARFADWKTVGAPGADPKLSIPMNRSAEAKLFVDAGIRPRISLMWVSPPDRKPDDAAQEKATLIGSVGLQILNTRLQEAASVSQPPFTGATAGREQVFHAARLTSLSVGFEPGQWQPALAAAERIRLGALKTGVTQEEVDRAVAQMHSSFQTVADAASTRLSRRIVGSILSEVASNDVFTSPERDLAASDADLKDLKADTVTAALKKIFGDSTPMIFLASTTDVEGGEPAIKAALLEDEKAATQMAEAAKPAGKTVWNHTDFGTPGRVMATGKIADLGATTVTFANGVKLTLRPSTLRAKQVLVSVKVGGGRLELPRDRATVAWASGAILSGGLKDMSSQDMERALTAKTVRTGFGVGEDGFIFSGSTTPGDMQTQLQVIAAYLTMPGFRPEGMEQTKSRYAAQLRQSDASPGTILRMKAPEVLHDGDKRWATPSAEEVDAARIDDLKALLTPVFDTGALDVTIVGDVDPDKAIAAVASTFGALPARAKARVGVTAQNDTHLPADKVTPIDLSHSRQNQVITSVVWPTHGEFPDVKDDITVELMGDIMQERLFDKLRGEGVSYSAGVGATASRVFDYGYIQAQAQLAPDKAAQFYDALGQITADLKAGKITADELDRARNPSLQEFEKSQQTNEYWLAVLDGIQEDQHLGDMARNFEAAAKSVQLSDITAAAQKYLTDPRMIKLTAGS